LISAVLCSFVVTWPDRSDHWNITRCGQSIIWCGGWGGGQDSIMPPALGSLWLWVVLDWGLTGTGCRVRVRGNPPCTVYVQCRYYLGKVESILLRNAYLFSNWFSISSTSSFRNCYSPVLICQNVNSEFFHLIQTIGDGVRGSSLHFWSRTSISLPESTLSLQPATRETWTAIYNRLLLPISCATISTG
jgi:hypothetical protein